MKNAGIYVRVSTERQAEEGYSINAQKENLIAYANDLNLNIFSIYADEGISGKNLEDRPAINRMLNDIKVGLIDVVLIYKFDRLTRDIADTEEIIKLVQKSGVLIHTLSSGIVDVTSPQGRFNTRIVGAVAQLEREQTIERIKLALKQKAKEGYSLCNATSPYGYNRLKGAKNLSINKKESKVVKDIYEMFIDGMTCFQIAAILNSKNIPTKKSSKERRIKWESKTIKLILTNPTYIGKIRYGINTKDYFEAKGFHKPLVNKEKWNKVQEIISKQKKVIRTNRPKSDAYYCGSLYCSNCNSKITTSRTKKQTGQTYVSYICSNKECGFSSISHLKVEKLFTDYLLNVEDFCEIKNLTTTSEKNFDYQKLINKAKRKKQDIIKLYVDNYIEKEELDSALKKINNQIQNYEHVLLKENPEVIDIKNISHRIEEHWKRLNNDEKYDFLTKFIRKIAVFSEKSKKRFQNVEFLL